MERRSVGFLFVATLLSGCPRGPLAEARAALEGGDLDRAGELFLRTARADPANLGAWDGAVEVWCRRKVAVARCLEVLDLELERLGSVARHHDALAISLESRARARLAAGLARSALSDLARAEAAAPERASLFVLRARAHATLGDAEAARSALEKALGLDPHHPEGRAFLTELPDPARPDNVEAGFGGDGPKP